MGEGDTAVAVGVSEWDADADTVVDVDVVAVTTIPVQIFRQRKVSMPNFSTTCSILYTRQRLTRCGQPGKN